MKKKLILFAVGLCLALSMNAQTVTNIQVLDTRYDSSGPNSYQQEAKFEFKDRSKVRVPGSGYYSGMLTIAPWGRWGDNAGNQNHQLNFNDGGIFYRTGWPSNTTWDSWRKLVLEDPNGNVGLGTNNAQDKVTVYDGNIRISPGTNTANGFMGKYSFSPGAGYLADPTAYIGGVYEGGAWYNGSAIVFATNAGPDITYLSSAVERMRINRYGYVGIGTTAPEYPLDVVGIIRAHRVKINTHKTADFVFAPTYKLPTLTEVETYIKTHKHLEGIAAAGEMEKDGIEIGDMQISLLQKIEELTIYSIEQNKKLEKLAEQVSVSTTQQLTIEKQNELIAALEKRIKELEAKK